MKHLFMLALLLNSLNLWSQTSRKLSLKNKLQNFDVVVQSNDHLFHPGFKNDVNTKALRHFVQTFQNARDILWRVSENGSEVTFKLNDENVTANYDKQGYPLSTIKYYTETDLDSSVARYVKNIAGTDFSIYLVSELINQGYTIFDVSLQSNKCWCKIKLLKRPDNSFEKMDNTIFFKG